MSELSLIFWLTAYSFGVVCIVIKTINYYKKLETIESIYFQISFLLLIISFTFSEYYYAVNSAKQNFNFDNIHTIFIEQFIMFSSVLLSYTIVLWIRSKKKIVKSPKMDKIFQLTFFILLTIFILSVIFYFNPIFNHSILIVLVASIIYTIVLSLKVPSKYDIALLNKLDKLFAIVTFIFLPSIVFIDMFYQEFSFIHFFQRIIPHRFHTVSLYYPFLCFFEILQSIVISRESSNSIITISKDFLKEYGISPRESEVLQLLIKGKSYQDIAKELFISLSTVKTHISKVYKKTSVVNKIELIYILNTYNKSLSV